MRLLLSALVLSMAVAAQAQDIPPEQLKKALIAVMQSNKVNAHMGLSGTVAQFKSDGDPNTLEIVFLKSDTEGANTVREDGEVIFLFDPTDDVQQRLIHQAFERKARRLIREQTKN